MTQTIIIKFIIPLKLSENESIDSIILKQFIHLYSMLDIGAPFADDVIKKALSLDIKLRHEDVFEFLHDLQHPIPHFLNTTATPLIERNPMVV